MEYQTIGANSAKMLNEKATDLLKDGGWKPHGGVSISALMRDNGGTLTYYAQAFVRDAD